MSVVVYAFGVMAADSRAYSGSSHPIGTKTKIHRLNDGGLVGICSNQVGMPESFRNWLNNGAKEDNFMPDSPCFDALHVTPSGEVFLYNDGYTPSGPVQADYFSIGSGRAYAHGALLSGATVERAVEVAIECDVWCGGPVTTLPLNP